MADHRDIELLKLRNFTVIKRVPDDIFTSKAGQTEIAEYFGAMAGFVRNPPFPLLFFFFCMFWVEVSSFYSPGTVTLNSNSHR
jgi:hypothetical protein